MEAEPETRILFLDVETSGLDPDKHVILELGAVLVDVNLVELGRRCWIFKSDDFDVLDTLETVDLHRASGLLDALDDDDVPGFSRAGVESALLRWLAYECAVPSGSLELAGFSIHFDRGFIRRHMPLFNRWLSHRMIDVSTLRTLHRRWRGELPKAHAAHRALADCEAAIADLASFRNALFGREVSNG